MDLAPVLDVSTDARNPVIGTRAYGADPDRVRRHAHAMADGLRSRGIGRCGKHFPGHGATSVDSHTALPRIDLPLGAVESEHLAPWDITPWLDAVMTAHVLVPALGEGPASIAPWSRPLLDGICGPGGFHGLVITDALDMAAVADDPGYAEAAVRAVEAGADLVCLGTSLRRDDQAMLCEAHDALVDAIESGRIARETLAARARRTRERIGEIRARRRSTAPVSLDDALAALAQIGAVAAARAVTVRGGALRRSGVTVVDARSRRDHASNSRGSALVDLLRAAGVDAWPGEADALPEGRDVIVVTRLPRADEAEGAIVRAVLAERSDAICLHVGVPDAAWRHDRTVFAHGASRANLAAAVAALLPEPAGLR